MLAFAVGSGGAARYVGNFNKVAVAVHVKEDTKIAIPATVSSTFVGERDDIAHKRVAGHFFKDAD